ncbi:hypothetical protein [Actinokineospora sp. NBRC 105648]|uniref:hypothetical protein n=1 Tax=Actinokineospora sp. NBRC 105648 TaxID=3032206 RepID=UPI00255660F4|nr:hypothetical protein [Actinokineospora sp. NBRC 105648]
MGNLFDNPMVLLIACCEVGFWVLLGAGLLARYVLRWRRVGAVLLVATPVVDVVLIVAAVLDIGRGAEATTAHALGAAYLGFSVAFGHSMVHWADQRVAHRFAGGPPPSRPPKRGPERVRHEWQEWRKCLLACSIGVAILALLSFVVGTPEHTETLWRDWIPKLGLVALVWFVIGPLWTMLDRRTT